MIEPKPFIEFLEYKKLNESDRPVTGNCEIHGAFDIKPLIMLNRLMGCTSVCPICSKEYKSWKSEQDEIKKETDRKELIERARNNKLERYGVTPRHYEKTFDTYIADTKEKALALKTCQYVCDSIVDGVCKNIIMIGSVGTGKTHLAASMCHYFAEKDERYDIKLSTVTELIRYYRSSYNNDNDLSQEEAINNITSKDLLIIDELGTSKGDDKELNVLFEVINSRYEYKKSTVLISNKSIEEVKELLGDRIIDRLKEDGCRILGMAWPSYRETNKNEF